MIAWFHTPTGTAVLHGALLGWWGAAAADIAVFRGFKNGWKDWSNFDWNTATYRWFWGIATGVAGALGLNLAGV